MTKLHYTHVNRTPSDLNLDVRHHHYNNAPRPPPCRPMLGQQTDRYWACIDWHTVAPPLWPFSVTGNQPIRKWSSYGSIFIILTY